MSAPRLTRALRAFASVTASVEDDISADNAELLRQRLVSSTNRWSTNITWTQLCRIIHSVASPKSSSQLEKLLKAAKEIVGANEGNFGFAEDAAVFLFRMFSYSKDGSVSREEMSRLQSYFGFLSREAVSSACYVVYAICSDLSEESCEHIRASLDSNGNNDKIVGKEFGETIKVKFVMNDDSIDEEIDWLESDEEQDLPDISIDFTNVASKLDQLNNRQAVTKNHVQKNKAVETFNIKKWLNDKMKTYFEGDNVGSSLTLDDIVRAVTELLVSERSDEQLQTELFDLLGFDRFELIQDLLSDRVFVMNSSFGVDVSLSDSFEPTKRSQDASRPLIGCQVVVQTQEERDLQKIMRREEKKFARKKDGNKFDDDYAMLAFDPQELRAAREAALREAASAPLFSSSRSVSTVTAEDCPYVFDSANAARQSSSFITGSKMLLPADIKRLNNNVYEEINIPANERPPHNFKFNTVLIDSLDNIAKKAFVGTKQLNLIQSVVFDAAYNSNENLLICAPTGAGKTNIAMLTVLHELKQHITDGVLRKDEFKIVYVAPMKALAAEMVRNFGQRLSALGITVMELTGDMQLSKAEIMKTQMLVTTPEKWDVVTRKSTGDVALTQIVRLLIIDEVHLLHDDRGSVIESLVARTLRQVESSQTMIRIVGLSATLPNYMDVARFLHVNRKKGLFFFDGRFRPVPLAQTFIGIKSTNRMQQMQDFNNVCYDKVIEQVRNGFQVMVFVHARNETVRTASVLCEMAKNKGHICMFAAEKSATLGEALKQIGHSRNRQLRELFPEGFAMHHAGMLRQDRNLVEKYFAQGLIRVIVCTATLAWGVNLPAHAVVIKGTQIYDAKKGSFVDLGILDVMQIFGRAGRPQFDTFGHGTILTTHDKLGHYLSLLTQQNPIESQFVNSLTDNLNAEVVLGTVATVDEAVRWLSYTYLYVRMLCNPLVYGISYNDLATDPTLENWRRELVTKAAQQLDKAHMVRFTERTGLLFSTDLGRTASHYYIKFDTVEVFNELFKQVMSEDKILEMVSQAQEFNQIKVRDEELEELDKHRLQSCHTAVAGGSENVHGKVNILLQTYISRGSIDNFSLVSDQAYVVTNSSRIVRALFEIALRSNWPLMAGRLLKLSKVVEKRLWDWEHPLRQFTYLPPEILGKIEQRGLSVDKLREMTATEIGHMIHHVNMGSRVKSCVEQIPVLDVDASVQPITRTVLRIVLKIKAAFNWNDRIHGKIGEPFWMWIEDPENNHIYHSEYFLMHKKHVVQQQAQTLVFTVPIFEPLPSQYYVRIISDRWLGSDSMQPISFQHLILPEKHPPHTDLLDLQPLPITALGDSRLEALYGFTHFNPVQTQIFHPLYHSDCNVLLGAPTGSGKTVAAELAIFRMFREHPESKAVYIAPLKALVRERMEDWKIRFEEKLGKKIVELTGDVAPDMQAVARADVIITTPEKWDGISRSWQTRSYVKSVTLLVIDEIHLLGNDRGPVLEVIVSRTNFISSHTESPVRVVGLSTALANARDLADWLGIKTVGLFNFRPSVRPVPLEVHIQGFPGKHYCPRMATMNKPAYQAIKQHSPEKPSLIFVSSRRQTRLTALDLIAYLAADDNPKQWMHMRDDEMTSAIANVRDASLKLTMAFGIGLHHAGLHEQDRKMVELLFVNQKIQVLIATSTLAWGVNFPAHLVVVKGTEYFDGKTKKYVDFPITDVLQMMGRAGRPQFDNQGVAVILVHDVKKHFYKKFLYEPFPVESNLLEVLADHLNAEIVAGTISSKQDAMDYITWTYFFRRLIVNPTYYKLDDISPDQINLFLSRLVQQAVNDLSLSYCIEVSDDEYSVLATTLGRISSYYYLNHLTVRMLRSRLTPSNTVPEIIAMLSDAHEFSELPVRHNEDQINSDLATRLPLPVNPHTYDSSNTKSNLLLQAHFGRIPLPSTDYHTDTKSVLDQVPRVLQAMLDVAADAGFLVTTLQVINVMQMVIQARWHTDNSLLTLPGVYPHHVSMLTRGRMDSPIECLPEFIDFIDGNFDRLHSLLGEDMSRVQLEHIMQAIEKLPLIEISMKIGCQSEEDAETSKKQTTVGRRVGAKREWIDVEVDMEYVLNVELKRINRTRRRDTRAYAPHFPKPKEEGWILVLGEIETHEVIALKRISCMRTSRMNSNVSFFTPEQPGRVIYTLYVMSDCYLGLDQQFDVCLNIVPSSLQSID